MTTSQEWIIWGILVGLSLLTLIIASIIYTIIYIKQRRKVLTIQKIAILGIFLAVFIIQAYFTRLFPHTNELIPFNLDDITIITIGFIFGPLEAIMFGSIADLLRTLIEGWSFQILAFFIFPLTGLISGIFGEKYRKNEQKGIIEKKKTYNRTAILINFQLLILIFIAFSAGAVFFISDEFTRSNIITYFVLSGIFLILIEWIFFAKFKNNDQQKLYLLLMISWAIIITRIITGYIIRPYAQHFYFGYDWRAAIIERIFTSTYLVPSKIFFGYLFIDSSFYVLNLQH